MVDQEIRVLGDENIIANPKNSQKQYPLTFKAVPNVIVYGRKKADLNFTVTITEGTNFNFNLERTAIIFSDSFNLEEYSYIMVKNPFEEISDFFYVSSLEELDPTGKEFNEFNDEVVKWLRRLVNIISNRCMIFETTLFKDLNNFPNIKSGQTFIRTEDGWTGITIRDINSELDLIFNKYVEEINKKIQEHQTQMNELLEQWKQDIQKYAENVKQYEIVRVVAQTGHGFVFEPVMYSISQRKFVKAVFPHGADGIAARVDDNSFKLVWAGRVEIPATAKDTQQRDFVLGEYYFLGEGSNGGIQREKPDTYYQHLFQVMYSYELRQNIADVLLSVPINQKGKRWDVGEAKTTVNDIEELKMSDFPVGKVVEVLGYYKAGDGADHKRIISTSDDGSGVQLNNGLWANIVHNGEVNVSWFGAKGDGVTDDTEAIQKAMNCSDVINLNSKSYKISAALLIKSNTVINGNGATIIHTVNDKCFANKNYNKEIIDSNISITDIAIDISEELITNNKCNLLYFCGVENININNIQLLKNANYGIYLGSYNLQKTNKNVNINNCIIKNFNLQGIAIICGENILINNCEITSNSETAINSIDIEPNHSYENTSRVIISNCYMNHTFMIDNVEAETISEITNCQIVNCEINSSGICIDSKKCSSLLINANRLISRDIAIVIQGDKSASNIVHNNINSMKQSVYITGAKLNSNISNNNLISENEHCIELVNSININIKGNIVVSKKVNKNSIYTRGNSENINIHNNFINGLNYGIYLSYGKNSIIKGNNFIFKDSQTLKRCITNQLFDNIIATNNLVGGSSEYDIKFNTDKKVEANNLDIVKAVSVNSLNSLYHMEKMKQENVYNDYISYMDEKTLYDKQQRKLEQDRQLAYEEALKENPELTYEEFMSVQPMTLNLVEEPQPSDALKKFMEKYL